MKRWLNLLYSSFGFVSRPQGAFGMVVVPSCGTVPLTGAAFEPRGNFVMDGMFEEPNFSVP